MTLKKKETLIVRDRLGIKPVFYCQINHTVYISSDVKTFLEIPEFKRDLDKKALTAFINLRFIPDPITIFKEAKKVPAGTFIRITEKTKKIEPISFWSPKIKLTKKTESELKVELLSAIKNAIKISSMGDSPPRILLSGGLDSCTIYNFAKDNLKNTIAFTCDYSTKHTPSKRESNFLLQEQHSELKFAKMITDKFNDDLQIIKIDLEDIKESFDDLVWSFGEPMASTDALGPFLLSKKLPKESKVLLSGLGVDELLGGYTHLFLDSGKFIEKPKKPIDFLKKFCNPSNPKELCSNLLNKKLIDEKFLITLIEKKMNSVEIPNIKKEQINFHMLFELFFDLPGWELSQTDFIYMAVSHEVRPVFLENNFVDLCLQIPSEFKFKNKTEKYIFKKALEGSLPREIINRKKHPSLGTPIELFRSNWFKEKFELAKKNKFNIFNKEELEKNLDDDLRYRIVILDTWLRRLSTYPLQK